MSFTPTWCGTELAPPPAEAAGEILGLVPLRQVREDTADTRGRRLEAALVAVVAAAAAVGVVVVVGRCPLLVSYFWWWGSSLETARLGLCRAQKGVKIEEDAKQNNSQQGEGRR